MTLQEIAKALTTELIKTRELKKSDGYDATVWQFSLAPLFDEINKLGYEVCAEQRGIAGTYVYFRKLRIPE